MSEKCARCGAAVKDGFVCARDGRELAQALTAAAGHAEDAEAVITRQVRRGGGGPRAGEERPMPNLGASAKLAVASNTIGTWARLLVKEGYAAPPARWTRTAGPLCKIGPRCPHVSCAALRVITPPSALAQECAWLSGQMEALRRHPDAKTAFDELHAACGSLSWLNDLPADRELVGVCDCGQVLYAREGQAIVRCRRPTCRLEWDVQRSRDILRNALRGKLFTASECSRLAAFWNDRTQPQIRALITSWTRPDRVRLTARGWIPNPDYTGDGEEPQGWATYLLGDVLDLLAATPRRHREGAAA